MKTIFITYDQAHHDNVIEVLTKSNARGYTLFESIGGCGTKKGEPHLGSHAWPAMNNSIMTIVDDERVEVILNRLHQLDEDNPLLGLRAFVWSVEQSI